MWTVSSSVQHERAEGKAPRGRQCLDYTERAQPGPTGLLPHAAPRCSEGLDRDCAVKALLRQCSFGCLINTYSYLLTFWKQNQEPLKGQSEHCASEPLGIFGTDPEQWCEHWTLIFQREGLCAQTWLSAGSWWGKADIDAPCVSLPHSY